MYQLIENFCLGTRRLEIFGRYHSLRRGWVTVTAEELMLSPEEAKDKDSAVPFDREKWDTQIKEMVQGGKCVVPNTPGEKNFNNSIRRTEIRILLYARQKLKVYDLNLPPLVAQVELEAWPRHPPSLVRVFQITRHFRSPRVWA